MQITRVGFGAWAIGGGGWAHGWGEQDDDASVAAIRHAIESGVNWIDTAAVYGLGHSEEVVARALQPYGDADRPFVFTKCGLVWDTTDPACRPAAQRRPGQPAAGGAKHRCAGCGPSASTCTRCTGPPPNPSRSTGRFCWT